MPTNSFTGMLRGGRWLEGDDSGSRIDGAVALTIMMLFVFCVAWIPSSIRSCCRRQRETRQGARSLVDARSQADMEILRRMMEEGGTLVGSEIGIGGMTAEDRREYIMNVLMTKRIILAPPQNLDEAEERNSPPALQRQKSDVVLSESDEDENRTTCAICLNEYEDGNEISWSHNEGCRHFFHRQCIAAWLMNHEGCPCCRLGFLSFNDEDDQLPVATPVEDDVDDEDDHVAFARGLELFLQFASEHSFGAAFNTLPHTQEEGRRGMSSRSRPRDHHSAAPGDAEDNTDIGSTGSSIDEAMIISGGDTEEPSVLLQGQVVRRTTTSVSSSSVETPGVIVDLPENQCCDECSQRDDDDNNIDSSEVREVRGVQRSQSSCEEE